MSVRDVRINITLPPQFLAEVDKRAWAMMVSRSAYIRLALLEKMGLQNMNDLQSPDETVKKDPDQEWNDFMDRLYGPDRRVT
jgi:metal-responsive CopG/Arc/MetJ family transcriptional regulator